MKWTFIAVFLFLSQLAFSQSQLDIKPLNPQPFVVYFQGDSLVSLEGEKVSAISSSQGLYKLEVILQDSIPVLLTSSVVLYDQDTTFVVIDNSSDTLGLILPIQEIVSPDVDASEILLNSRTLSTEVVKINNIACPRPMDASSFESLKEDVKGNLFQRERLKLLKQALADNCVTTSQMDELLFFIDEEDQKLEELFNAEDHIFDIRNLTILEEQFVLTKYRKLFQDWLIMVKNQG